MIYEKILNILNLLQDFPCVYVCTHRRERKTVSKRTYLFDELSGALDDPGSGIADNTSHLHAIPPVIITNIRNKKVVLGDVGKPKCRGLYNFRK
jgi:hypothetical protein